MQVRVYIRAPGALVIDSCEYLTLVLGAKLWSSEGHTLNLWDDCQASSLFSPCIRALLLDWSQAQLCLKESISTCKDLEKVSKLFPFNFAMFLLNILQWHPCVLNKDNVLDNFHKTLQKDISASCDGELTSPWMMGKQEKMLYKDSTCLVTARVQNFNSWEHKKKTKIKLGLDEWLSW